MRRTLISILLVGCVGIALLGALPPAYAQNNETNTPFPTNTPRQRATPSPTYTPPPTVTPAPTTISTLIPGGFGGADATWTPLPPTESNVVEGHFLFRRPFSDDLITYWARNYAYGSTSNGNLRVHHGLDFPNPSGTPVLAAADGVVYWAGEDVTTLFGPQPDFYGRLIVIEHPFQYVGGIKIYTLYGHLRDVNVTVGETVTAGQVIGYVGSAGIAAGAHLHFEVRTGEPENYYATRNPELWLAPYPNTGVVAARVMDVNGTPLQGVMVEVKSPGVYQQAWTYTGFNVNGDLGFNENVTVPDVPAGYHTLTITGADTILRYRRIVYVEAGKVTLVTINIQP